MIPKRLKLVNSIGLYEGVGKREIEIDFTQFNPGVVGIFGRTGSGKSTIMENMTPFRRLITRPGKLHDHFMEKGLREFEFEMEGHTYLSRILIDADKKKTIAQLYKDGTTKDHLLNDKLEEYDAHIAEIIGDYDLFINGVFAPQTENYIITMKDAPMKSLFMMLFNLEKYSNSYLPLLKLRRDDVEKRLQGVRSAYEILEKDVAEMIEVKDEIVKIEIMIPSLEKQSRLSENALHEHQDIIVKKKQELTKTIIQNDSLNDKRKQVKDLQKELEGMADEVAKEAREIEIQVKSNGVESDLAISDKETMDREIKRAEKIINNKKLILEKVDRLKDLKIVLESVGSAEKELLITKEMHDNIARDIVRLQRDIEILEHVPCIGTKYYDTCELLINAIASKNTLKEKKQDKKSSDIQIKNLENDEELANHTQKELDILDKDNWEQVKTELVLAEKSIGGWRERLEKSEQRIITCAEIKIGLEKKLVGLEDKINKKTATKKEKKTVLEQEISGLEKNEEIIGLEAEIKRLEFLTHKVQNELTTANNDLQIAKTRVEEYKKNDDLLIRKQDSLNIKIKEQNTFIKDLEEWNILEKFFKEAPVYELESLAQVTTEFANNLISLYDDSFSMKIVTTLPKSGNKGIKEVFKIMVFNNGKEILAYNLSGGQKQIFDTVLRMSIVLTLDSTQSKRFMSSFWDESASSIDPENAIKYMEMHYRALEMSNKHFTFIISHHEKTQSMIDQRILVEDL
jgi:exonuclease SbcC